MRRSLVISLCLINACIAAGLLWYVLGPGKRSPKLVAPSTNAPAQSYSVDELWQRAEAAKTSRDAAAYLNQLENSERFNEQVADKIESLLSGKMDEPAQWPFYQALLQVHAAKSRQQEELSTMRMLAQDKGQSLTIRDSAIRNYLNHAVRIGMTPAASEDALALIDAIYKEPNSLSEMALLAENFLFRNGAIVPDRAAAFEERLRSALVDTGAVEAKRIAALEILTERGWAEAAALRGIYNESGVRLRTSLLKSLRSLEASEQTKKWARGVQPTSPEQESLLLQILSK